jgi:hypothetical protein
MVMKSVRALGHEIGYPKLPGEPIRYWQGTTAPSGNAHPNLVKADLEALAMKWLAEGKGNKLWPNKRGAVCQWERDEAKITRNVKDIFVAQWVQWRGNANRKKPEGLKRQAKKKPVATGT